MKAVIFDTETTGLVKPGLADLSKQPKIIELGLVIVEKLPHSGEWRIAEERNWLINPGEPITAEITKITGIKDEDVAGKPGFAEVWVEASDFFTGANITVAHNHPFDKAMVDNEVQRHIGEPFGCGWPAIQICTVQEFTHAFGHRPKLTDLYQRYMGKPLEQTHRASDDAKALAEVLLAINFFDSI